MSCDTLPFVHVRSHRFRRALRRALTSGKADLFEWGRGSWYMGLVLLCVIWLITLASTYFFVAKTWWLPAGASAAAAAIDHQFAVTFVIMGVVFVAAQMALGFLVWKYRDQSSGKYSDYSHGNTKLEIVWTTLT